jgi:predicted regulator of Ras-like GTPase activity (Roadblock/LC7/MglB family)
MATNSRSEQLTKLLRTLSSTTPDIEAAAVVDNDGMMIASSLPADIEEDNVAAMSAAMLGLGERIVSELRRGQFELVSLKGKEGYVILVRSGPDAVLSVLASGSAKLGLIFLDSARTAKEIARLLG